ncbi:SDR family oxidoreductase [Halomicrobium urmianum]|uniref:SDR family oxidoreductase n=1 Tax=Halomicrobium urmianum TaxID=1586233 RepID=UPI001CD99792|nr:SDR family oxidoreductase [Halomicrobium urmianum]
MTKTVLITGCSSGIGRETAAAFLEDEWRVWATARDEEDVSDLAAEGCATAELDVTDPREVEAVVDELLAEEGRLDCLVNNAGYGQFGPVEDVPTGVVHEQFDVNVYGPHRLVREVLPHMRDRGEGTIINLSSVTGRLATPGNGVYAGSKFALEGMSDALRAEVKSEGVDVVLVEPGPVDTQFEDRAMSTLAEADRSPDYDWLYDLYDDAEMIGGEAVSIPPRDVALTIRDAAQASNPEPRYPVGQFAKYAMLARHVPARWRDTALSVARKLSEFRTSRSE